MKTAIIIKPIQELNFGQIVDVIIRDKNHSLVRPQSTMDTFPILVKNSVIQMTDTAYDYTTKPCVYNPNK